MENKEIKTTQKEEINKLEYKAVFLSEEHIQGTSKEGKAYDIGKLSFQVVVPNVDKTTGEVTQKKVTMDVVCDPSVLPNGSIEEYSACKAIYEAPVDPSYGRLRFVKLMK